MSAFEHLGIKPSRLYIPHDQNFMGKRLIEFLASHFSHISVEQWQQRFAQGLISLASGEKLAMDAPYLSGETIVYYRHVENEPIIPFEPRILYMDEHLLVVDKPHFLAVSPTGRYVKETLLVRLKQQLGNPDISPIHRLDRETAGVILFSLQPNTRSTYHALFEQHQVKKTYHAIAPHKAELQFPLNYQSHMTKGDPFFVMKEIDKQANSFTQIDLLTVNGDFALYELKPISGKQHQLRVHMSALGVPILNDGFYPQVQFKNDNDFSSPLQLLAKSITFIDPISQQKVCYDSERQLKF